MTIIHRMKGNFRTKGDLLSAFELVRKGNTFVVLDGRSLNVGEFPPAGMTSTHHFDASKIRLVIAPVPEDALVPGGLPGFSKTSVALFKLREVFPRDVIRVVSKIEMTDSEFGLLSDGKPRKPNYCAVFERLPAGTKLELVQVGHPHYSQELRIVK